MNWPAIFLGCFVIGFILSTLSFALGAMHAHFHVRLPWAHHLPGHLARGAGARGVGPINAATVTAFLAWFGGTGYLLTTQFRWLVLPAVILSLLLGLTGAAMVFWIMARVLWSPWENMQRADYEMTGVLARVSQAIRAGGIGEIVYSHGTGRKSCAARSTDGRPIEKRAEVVVTGYDRGIATVQRWSDLAADE
jgi:hypothetical protein